MAQHKQVSWTELRVGLFVLFAMIVVVLAIFYVTGSAGIFGGKYTVYTYLPEVDGLQVGAPVALAGVDIGNVQDIVLNPHPTGPADNIELVLRINKKYSEYVRTDSNASLITEGLLGNRYVTIERGHTGAVIPPNGIVPGKEEVAIKQIVERGADLVQNLGALSVQVRQIVDSVQQGQGTIGKFIKDPTLYNHLDSAVTKIDAVVTATQQGQGTLGKLLTNDELYNKANATMGHAESVLSAVREQKGTMGKLIYDPAVYQESKEFIEHGNKFFSDVQAGKGTLGKLVTDDTLYNNIRDASGNVRDATAKLNSNEGTAGKFFADPQLYDNMTALSGDLRLLIADFRKDPKKFLHVKFSIF
ncbi:MAG: MlaD family protein [Candidatus Acidiferrales bacterium]